MRKFIRLAFRPMSAAQMPRAQYFIFLVIEALVFPTVQLLLSLAQKNLVNMIEFHEPQFLSRVYLFSAAILLLVWIVNPIAEFFMTKSVRQFMRNLRTAAFDKLLTLPLSFFDRTHSGEVATKLSDDLDAIGSIYTWSFLRFLLAIFYGLGSLCVMVFLRWELAVFTVLITVVETWIIAKASVKIRESSQFVQEAIESGNALFLDIIRGIRMIRMLSVGHILKSKCMQANESIATHTIQRNKKTLLVNTLSDLFGAVNLIGIFGFGIFLYFLDYVDLGSVMAFLILQDGIAYMLYNLGEFFPSMQQSFASVERIFELLTEESEPRHPDSLITPLSNENIRCENLSFRYPSHPDSVLSGADCEIASGKITTITGASGGGKSTWIKLMLGLYTPDQGKRFIGAHEYSELPLDVVRDHYAYVPQSVYLFNDTIEANIRCGLSGLPFEAVKAAAQAANAHEFIMEKPEGYQTKVLEYGSNFSGGQKQRIAIARAILKDAPVFVWDEATSALDGKNEYDIHEYMKFQAQSGKTILFVTHRKSLTEVADNEVVVNDGKIQTLHG